MKTKKKNSCRLSLIRSSNCIEVIKQIRNLKESVTNKRCASFGCTNLELLHGGRKTMTKCEQVSDMCLEAHSLLPRPLT